MILVPVDVARELRDAGFPQLILVVATATMLAESDGVEDGVYGCRTDLRTRNNRGDDSLGFCQINMKPDSPYGDLGAERRRAYGLRSNEDLYDPRTCARVAFGIFSSEGHGTLQPWGGFRGDGRTDLPPPYMRYGRYQIAQRAVAELHDTKGPVMLGDSPLVSYYRQAKHYSAPNGTIDRIVIHDMEYPETPQGAEWCVNYMAETDRDASTHYSVDNNTICQGVRESQRAWHAPPNMHSIGIEHAGYMAQSRSQWTDEYSLAELKLSAKLTAELCKRHAIPVVKLSADDLLNGKRGICGHVDVSNAWHQTDHGDPGPNFPWDLYLAWVKEEMDGPHPAPVPIVEEEEMQLVAEKNTHDSYLWTGANLLAFKGWRNLADLFGITEDDAKKRFKVRYLEADHPIWKLPKVA